MAENLRRIVPILAVALAACGGAEAQAPTAAVPGAAVAPMPDDHAAELSRVCRDSFARQAACTEAFIPALVDMRVAIDLPQGIAARAEAEGRDALYAVAMAEWAVDSQPDNAAKTCDAMASNMPEDLRRQMAADANACLAEAGCDAYVACVIPVMRAGMERAPR